MPFTVYPAIDVKDRQIVRLSEGEMASATVYGDAPAEQAAMFGKAGAEWLHIVDLNGAVEGKSKNREVIEESINSFPGRVQVGGGVRSRSAIMNWIEAGAKRVVLGTAALKDPDLVNKLGVFSKYGGGCAQARGSLYLGWTANSLFDTR